MPKEKSQKKKDSTFFHMNIMYLFTSVNYFVTFFSPEPCVWKIRRKEVFTSGSYLLEEMHIFQINMGRTSYKTPPP